MLQKEDTIVALSTPQGVGAIALIRLSGKKAFEICQKIFRGKDLAKQNSHTLHFGRIENEKQEIIDEVVVGIYKSPKSFTKENIVEISCHASPFIVEEILKLLLKNGARLAEAGEFTQRAYLNGQMDLAQAEAIADLIASNSRASHQIAMQQMRGGFSKKIKQLREDFIGLAALLELELDFSEEDVEFADRTQLKNQSLEIKKNIIAMLQSFDLGNAIKKGVPVAIVGKPNAGKSTLLNTLLEEEKAIVSDIAGTTRDTIEDEKVINGIIFRFIDTAGLRETEDTIEKIGVARTLAKMQEARILIYLFDAVHENSNDIVAEVQKLKVKLPKTKILLVANKIDEYARYTFIFPEGIEGCAISAKDGTGLEKLTKLLYKSVTQEHQSDVIVSNLRHYESLQKTLEALERVENGLALQISTEMLASDIREASHHLGTITGDISNNDILGHIFSKFCIGK